MEHLKHNRTPWHVVYSECGEKWVEGIRSADCLGGICDFDVCETDSGACGPKRDDAKFIVLACNNFEFLVEALEAAKEKLQVYRKHSDGWYTGGMEYTMLMSKIEAVLMRIHET